MLLHLTDLEPDLDGFGDAAGSGEPPAAEPAPDPAADATPAAAEPGPDYVSRAELDQYLNDWQAQQAWAYSQAYPELYGDPAAQQQPQQPVELDPFADNFGDSLRDLIRGAVAEATQPVQQMLDPIAQSWHDQQAQAMTDHLLNAEQVPADEQWRHAVLAASKAYEVDQYGRPVPPQYALRNAYALQQQLIAHERAKWEAERAAAEQRQTEHLRTVSGAPSLPSGSAGVEGDPAVTDLRQAARSAWERIRAA